MMELLVASGHDPDKVVDYSLDRLEAYYELASARRAKEDASLALYFCQSLRASIVAALDKKGDKAWKDYTRELQNLLLDTEKHEDEASKVNTVAEAFRRLV